jgi:hypothetical protein
LDYLYYQPHSDQGLQDMTDILDLFEPEVRRLAQGASLVESAHVSSAISLKRIADALASGDIFRQPVNQYGESFTDAIQNGLVRGQNGIDTNYGQ